MRIIDLPRPQNIHSEAGIRALERFRPLALSDTGSDTELNILGEISAFPWREYGEASAQTVAEFLARAAGRDVVININSPGGDMFEGIAIYNMLLQYAGRVDVKVIGMAASAASIICMGADSVQIAPSAFLMIHNCWLFCAGNRHDLMAVAAQIEPFDKAMAQIYAEKSGMDTAQIAVMMDNETYISGSQAIDMGLADVLLQNGAIPESSGDRNAQAAQRLEMLLAKQGQSRSQRRELLQAYRNGTRNAAGNATRDAGEAEDLLQGLRSLNAELSA